MFEMQFSPLDVNRSSSSNIYQFRDIGIPKYFYASLPFIFRVLLYRNKINMNTFILIVGNPRTSKSYCAMKIAEVYEQKLGKTFDVEKQLTFSDVKKFFMWSQNAENSIFILDETGTSLSPDMFWSLQQRIMRKFVQTQGFRKNVLIWVLPSIVFIQKGFRFMSNYAVKTIKQGTSEIYKIVVDQLRGKGFPDRVEILNYSFPKEETCRKYEGMKKEWNDKELANDIAFLDQLERGYTKGLTKGEILEMYNREIIGYDDAFDKLVQSNYSVVDAGLLLDTIKPT